MDADDHPRQTPISVGAGQSLSPDGRQPWTSMTSTLPQPGILHGARSRAAKHRPKPSCPPLLRCCVASLRIFAPLGARGRRDRSFPPELSSGVSMRDAEAGFGPSGDFVPPTVTVARARRSTAIVSLLPFGPEASGLRIVFRGVRASSGGRTPVSACAPQRRCSVFRTWQEV